MCAAVDPLRPHFARAGLLAARLGLKRARNAVATLEAPELPAAVTTASGRALVPNSLLETLEVVQPAAHGMVSLSDTDADSLFQDALSVVDVRSAWSRSIPIRARDERPPAVLHVMPLPGAARGIFSGAAILLIITELSLEHRGLAARPSRVAIVLIGLAVATVLVLFLSRPVTEASQADAPLLQNNRHRHGADRYGPAVDVAGWW